jgi:predicted nucleic acid-binding protein
MLVVDTCVLIDIADDDPDFGRPSALCLARHLDEGLVISPVSYVELAPVFDGSTRKLDEFLDGLGADHHQLFELSDRATAFSAWAHHISTKRAGRAPRRPVADALIGALAVRTGGLITRNGADFTSLYPDLRIVDPTRSPRRSGSVHER